MIEKELLRTIEETAKEFFQKVGVDGTVQVKADEEFVKLTVPSLLRLFNIIWRSRNLTHTIKREFRAITK